MSSQLFATNDGLKQGVLQMLNTKYLALYQSPTILAKGFDPTTLVEATFSGYARINIYSLGWSWPAVIDSDGNASSYTSQVTFRKTGAVGNANVYGFYYLASDNFTVYAAQPFADGPYRMTVDGDYIRITPRWACSNPIFA